MTDDIHLLRKQTELAIRAVEISIREVAQVTRCLAIAVAYSFEGEHKLALEQINQVVGRLERAESYLDRAVSAVSSADDASR